MNSEKRTLQSLQGCTAQVEERLDCRIVGELDRISDSFSVDCLDELVENRDAIFVGTNRFWYTNLDSTCMFATREFGWSTYFREDGTIVLASVNSTEVFPLTTAEDLSSFFLFGDALHLMYGYEEEHLCLWRSEAKRTLLDRLRAVFR